MRLETAFTMDTSSIKFGPGVTREVGEDARGFGIRRVMVVTDARLRSHDAVTVALDALKAAGVETVLYDATRVEPTDASFKAAIAVANSERVDGFIAIGGGSVIDTAKAANLYTSYPDDFLAYVNPPIGQGKPVPGPVKPLIAIPTTAGTGSETTGVAIFDLVEMKAKTGIANRALRPVLGIVDPLNHLSMPPMITACSALDILCHAVESYTAIPYQQRPAADSPKMRPSYQGANPISDFWATKATEMMAANLPRVLADPGDVEARGDMALAATYAGIGFGNAGVHLPHGMSYPVAGMVRGYEAPDYDRDHAMVPHGMSVILNAPAVFRYTAQADPARHLEAARQLGADIRGAAPEDAGEILAQAIIRIMRLTSMPSGLAAVGYTEADIPALVEGTLPQHRVTKLSPRPAGREELAALFKDAMRYW